jgi:hypothetical protein
MLDQRLVAARNDIVDDAPDDLVDILGNLAFRMKKLGEGAREIRIPGVEPLRHQVCSASIL